MHIVNVSECLKEIGRGIKSYLAKTYLRLMEHTDLVLSTLAQIVEETAQPTLYQFIPRELILRLPIEWSEIFTCLTALEEDGAVQIFHADTVKFSITEKGLEFAKELQIQKESNSPQVN